MIRNIICIWSVLTWFACAQGEQRQVLRAQHVAGEEEIQPSGGLGGISPPAVVEKPAPPAVAPAPEVPAKPAEAKVTVQPMNVDRGTQPISTPVENAPPEGKPTGDDAVRLQVFLDEANFGPGVIDGKPGRFTELAVKSWNEVHGYPTADWAMVNRAARQGVPNPYGLAVVPGVATKWVSRNVPNDREAQSKLKLLPYRSYAEFMSERYHTDVEYLIELNGSKKIYNLGPRSSLLVPNVKPFLIENLHMGARHETDEQLAARHIVVDTKINQARIFEGAPSAIIVDENGNETQANRALIASFPITPGQPKFIKYGVWELKNMIELPSWRYDKQLLATGKRGKEALQIPPGPNVPVGVMWNGLSKPGIGLHGTSDPETIGRARSAGCVRLSNWDVVKLPELVRPGATVEIR